MEIVDISTTEEMVLNPEYVGLRHARIEVYVEDEHYPIECGVIRVWNNDGLFERLRELIEGCLNGKKES